ncbi:uncharacterized protein LOC124804985 [Schistocerca piceifrons]|uniref:uncharacterized protein LOC124804985 n=1 Tax=Schistocerca piceifrons TaxID=274613 RepID=UPI001F5F8881|nr:uncharacterized protein LOC124804985 [Schistocerca piceifrons]
MKQETFFRNAVHASEHDAVIFAGSGCTGAVHKLIHALNLPEPPVVFVGPCEHHSNLLPWREIGSKIVRIRETKEGHLDLVDLEQQLQAHHGLGPKLIGCFSAASNVTGVLADDIATTLLLHQYGALAFWDYASAAPYVKLDMNPILPGVDETAVHKDAMFFSVHKFVGGVQSPGVLVAKKVLFNNPVPNGCGGGTVFFVTRDGHRYLQDTELREEGGTAAVVESVRAGLSMQLKEAVGTQAIMAREHKITRMVLAHMRTIPELILLGPRCQSSKRLPIFSFMVRHPRGVFLHHNFVCTVLNDVFGIQARGGCACAGPYAQDLLGIPEELAQEYEEVLLEDRRLDRTHLRRHEEHSSFEMLRPGFARISLPFFMADQEVAFVLEAIKMVATEGWKLLPQYILNPETGEWRHHTNTVFRERKWLGHIRYTDGKMTVSERRISCLGTFPQDYADCLHTARNIFNKARKMAQRYPLADQCVMFDEHTEKLRWFMLPSEAQDLLLGHSRRVKHHVPFEPAIYGGSRGSPVPPPVAEESSLPPSPEALPRHGSLPCIAPRLSGGRPISPAVPSHRGEHGRARCYSLGSGSIPPPLSPETAAVLGCMVGQRSCGSQTDLTDRPPYVGSPLHVVTSTPDMVGALGSPHSPEDIRAYVQEVTQSLATEIKSEIREVISKVDVLLSDSEGNGYSSSCDTPPPTRSSSLKQSQQTPRKAPASPTPQTPPPQQQTPVQQLPVKQPQSQEIPFQKSTSEVAQIQQQLTQEVQIQQPLPQGAKIQKPQPQEAQIQQPMPQGAEFQQPLSQEEQFQQPPLQLPPTQQQPLQISPPQQLLLQQSPPQQVFPQQPPPAQQQQSLQSSPPHQLLLQQSPPQQLLFQQSPPQQLLLQQSPPHQLLLQQSPVQQPLLQQTSPQQLLLQHSPPQQILVQQSPQQITSSQMPGETLTTTLIQSQGVPADNVAFLTTADVADYIKEMTAEMTSEVKSEIRDMVSQVDELLADNTEGRISDSSASPSSANGSLLSPQQTEQKNITGPLAPVSESDTSTSPDEPPSSSIQTISEPMSESISEQDSTCNPESISQKVATDQKLELHESAGATAESSGTAPQSSECSSDETVIHVLRGETQSQDSGINLTSHESDSGSPVPSTGSFSGGMVAEACRAAAAERQREALEAAAGILGGPPVARWHCPPKSIWKPAVEALQEFDMVRDGDRVMVCLSGGKDSLSLLHTLHQYQFYAKAKGVNFTLGAATVDPGSPAYDPRPLIPYLEALGVHYLYEEQKILDQAAMLDKCTSVCSFCSRMKRGRLYAAARMNGYNVLALGQHLDDITESFLMSVFHNGRLRTMKAHYWIRERDLRVIRPFIYVREKSLRQFAESRNLPIIPENCPACFEAPKERHRSKQLLAQQEILFPKLFWSLRSALHPLISFRQTGEESKAYARHRKHSSNMMERAQDSSESEEEAVP